jgi:hypothetical protein
MQALLNVPCKGGSLRVMPDGYLVRVSMTGQTLWQIPAQSVTIANVSQKIMASLEICSPYGNHLIEWVSPDNIPRLQQALAQAPMPAPQATYPQWQAGQMAPPPPPPPYPSPQFQAQAPGKRSTWQWYRSRSKPARVGLGCLALVAVFLVCGTCNGVLANMTHPAAADQRAIITSTSTSNQVVPTNTPNNSLAIATDTPTATATPMQTPQATPTPTPTPTAKPTQKPAPKPTPTPQAKTGVNGNPWGYDFNAGNLIYNPPTNFCTYFNCITTFWNGQGYVVECQDTTYSKSGGRSGSCSHHGGNLRPLYSH